MKYYLVKLLTNTAGEDGSTIAVYTDDTTGDNPKTGHDKALVAYHNSLASFYNASDVLFVTVEVLDENGNNVIKETIDNRPAPEPTPNEE